MEKLSGILPNSPRVKSVDLSEAKPRRPGAPSFGVPVSTTSAKDRVTISSGVEDASKDLLTYKNPKEAHSAKIAENISRKFFETRLIKEPVAAKTEPKMELKAEPKVELKPEFKAEIAAEGAADLSPGKELKETDEVSAAASAAYSPERISLDEAPLKQAVE